MKIFHHRVLVDIIWDAKAGWRSQELKKKKQRISWEESQSK